MQPIELAQIHLGKYKERNGEIIAEQCPFCNPTKKDNLYKFYMNRETGAFKCYRENKCGRTGSFYELLEYFDELEGKKEKTKFQKTYKKPKTETKDPDSRVEKYLKKRQISKETWQTNNVKEKDGNIAFEYYQNDELVLVKYRNTKKGKKKKYWQEGGGKPVLWNIDNININRPLVICEGEFDALAVYEAGYENVVSVPFGSNNFKWVEHCWNTLEKLDEIIVWTDSDQAGRKMQDEIIKRLGKYRCKYVETDKAKDANNLLYKEGEEAIISEIENAKEIPITQLKQMHEIEVFDPENTPRVKSNIPLVNKYLGGYLEGMITIWTGSNGSGKSTFLNQQVLEAIEQDKPTCIVSGELTNSMLRYWLELQAAGKEYINSKWDNVRQEKSYYVRKEQKEKIREWCRDKLFIYDSFETLKPQELLEVFKGARKRHNVRNFVVDNLMVLNYSGTKNEKYNKQANFVGQCKDFAKNYNSHVHIVAHPNKTDGIVTKEDVAGLYEITNHADNVCCITRVEGKVQEQLPDKYAFADNLVRIFKCRVYGTQNVAIKLEFDEVSKRFQQEAGDNTDTEYSWKEYQEDEDNYEGYSEEAKF